MKFKFKQWLKEVFCRHIYHTHTEKYLQTSREQDGGYFWGLPTYSRFSHHALFQTCLKCDKEKIEVGYRVISNTEGLY